MRNRELLKIYSKKQIKKTNDLIKFSGRKINAIDFLDLRWLFSVLVFIICLYILPFGYLTALLVGIIFYFLVTYFVFNKKIDERRKLLEKESIDFFEILVLTLDSGKNLEQALLITTEAISGEISLLFRKVLMEVRFGKSLNEALSGIKDFIPSDAINNVVLSMMQTNVHGGGLVTNIENQLNFIKNKKVLEVRGEINKIPNKISIVSVLFIIPLMLLIILGPVLINFMLS